jgi:hypothetical protein
MIMEEKKNETIEEQEMGGNEEVEEELPYCRTASVAEHARAYDEDEPCDDFRSGDTGSRNESR